MYLIRLTGNTTTVGGGGGGGNDGTINTPDTTSEQSYKCSRCLSIATVAYDNGKVTNYSGFILYCDKCLLECNPEIKILPQSIT